MGPHTERFKKIKVTTRKEGKEKDKSSGTTRSLPGRATKTFWGDVRISNVFKGNFNGPKMCGGGKEGNRVGKVVWKPLSFEANSQNSWSFNELGIRGLFPRNGASVQQAIAGEGEWLGRLEPSGGLTRNQ